MSSVARRYAKAIASIAKETGAFDVIGTELRTLAGLAADPTIGPVLANPLLSPASRQSIARSLGEQLRLAPMTRNFLGLLADHQRLDQLVGIADQYERIVDRELGRVRARIHTAVELNEEQQQAVDAALERLTGKTVIAERSVDRELLGGMVVEVEGKVYDGSVRTQLRRLASAMAGGRSFL
jgi:F-type H+-transporting ATPase subunit delta